ncbi:alkylglycerol monooxygenase-like [Oppia nitens]|uniref:alkylglycerol monooxygenase-like n=1 Tax=Oppia nitens TaxID=1686743 RepID=UPI0023DA2B2C|nr:alkylglycerol monooxygenase-like [Oppia nitens]
MDWPIDQLYGLLNYIYQRIGYLFYLVDPRQCMFEHVYQVPRYVEEMFPVFIALAIAENGLRLVKGKPIYRFNDTIASVGQGIFQECVRLKLRSFEVLVYCMVWDNYRLLSMPWDSLTTWLLCFLGVDLGFYIFHRISHEVNIIWAVHQAHHSAEDFTMISALRQAVLQPFTAWFAYLPMALFIPPSIFLTHLQLSEIYMIWIHTEAIGSLGPLEWLLNTPSHHRVHHGRNRPYIDKNYGGTLIIWDRLFGTFQSEDTVGEPVVYGLVHPVQSYNPFYLQFHHWIRIGQSVFRAENWSNRFGHLFYGPGWSPGKPRLGLATDVPLIDHPVEYWSPAIPFWQNVYTIVHFLLILGYYYTVADGHRQLSQQTISYCIVVLLVSLTTIGLLLENSRFGLHLELD